MLIKKGVYEIWFDNVDNNSWLLKFLFRKEI